MTREIGPDLKTCLEGLRNSIGVDNENAMLWVRDAIGALAHGAGCIPIIGVAYGGGGGGASVDVARGGAGGGVVTPGGPPPGALRCQPSESPERLDDEDALLGRMAQTWRDARCTPEPMTIESSGKALMGHVLALLKREGWVRDTSLGMTEALRCLRAARDEAAALRKERGKANVEITRLRNRRDDDTHTINRLRSERAILLAVRDAVIMAPPPGPAWLRLDAALEAAKDIR